MKHPLRPLPGVQSPQRHDGGHPCRAALTRFAASAGLAALILLAGLIVGSGCATATDADRAGSGKTACCADELSAAAPVSDDSLYQLDSSWTNDARSSIKLVSFRGRPQVVIMFFTSCEYACPVLVHDLKRIEAALPGNVLTNVGFALVSFDTERDTPEALATYRKNHELAANWTLLRGAPDDVLELAALLGVKFKKDQRGQFAHSNIITVLDANGVIAKQQQGLNQSVDDVVSTLKRMAAR